MSMHDGVASPDLAPDAVRMVALHPGNGILISACIDTGEGFPGTPIDHVDAILSHGSIPLHYPPVVSLAVMARPSTAFARPFPCLSRKQPTWDVVVTKPDGGMLRWPA